MSTKSIHHSWFINSVLVAAGLFFLGIAFLSVRSSQKPLSLPNIHKTIIQTGVVGSLPEGKIAYVKGGNLFVFEKEKSTQLTSDGYVSKVMWSKDGTLLGWINNRKIRTGGVIEYLPISIMVRNMKTGKVQGIVMDEPNIENKDNVIHDFDFSPDNKKIVYVYNGIRLVSLATDKEEELLTDKIDDKDPISNEYYYGVSWNPKNNMLLLTKNIREASYVEIYNLSGNTSGTVQLKNISTTWSEDGKEILAWRESGRDAGGLWVINPQTVVATGIIGNLSTEYQPKVVIPGVSIRDMAFSDRIVGEMNIFIPIAKKENKLPYLASNIYLISREGVPAVVTKNMDDRIFLNTVAWSPSEKYITYLSVNSSKVHDDDTKTLHVIHTDGSNDRLVLKNINTYSWSPSL